MLTLLNRLFPEDISQLIINIIRNENIKELCINKYILMEPMMQNIINKYSLHKKYDIIYNISNIKHIYNMHQFIIKNDNIILNDIRDIINNYYKILIYHNTYQSNYVKKIVEKYII